MKMYSLMGGLINKPLTKYIIDWDGKSLSQVQFNAKQFLRPYWQHHTVTEEFKIPGSRLSCDLLNWSLMIAVEIDGGFHDKFSKFHHGDNVWNWIKSVKRDARKDNWLKKNNFVVWRINEKDVPKLTPEWIKNQFDYDLI